MRAALLLLMLSAACAPDIVPGSYACGPEQLCPEGQFCNTVDGICGTRAQALPFGCFENTDEVGDDTSATARPLGELDCVSRVVAIEGCLAQPDPADYVQFETRAVCTAVAMTARLTFPIAFEPLVLELDGTVGETPCTSGGGVGETESVRCLEMTLTPGSSHVLGVRHAGEANCDGACAFNRYQLRLQVVSP